MPPMETAYRRQTAVLWEWLREDAYNEPVLDEPVEIAVRWKWGRREALSPQGTPIAVDATVVVAQDIAVGSLLYEGTLNEWYGHSGTGSGSAGQDTALMQVVTFSSTPDLKNRNRRRTAGLVYFRDEMPEVE